MDNEFLVSAAHHKHAKTYNMPLKAKKVQVVFCGPLEEYGLHPLSNQEPSKALEHLITEYNKTSGRVKYKFHDLRKWRKQGILMLDSNSRDMRNVVHFLRYLSLSRKNIVFIFAYDKDKCEYLSTLLSESSDDSNHYLWYPSFKDSSVFKHVDSIRNFLNLEKIDWNPV